MSERAPSTMTRLALTLSFVCLSLCMNLEVGWAQTNSVDPPNPASSPVGPLTAARALELAAERDPSLRAVVVEAERAGLLVSLEENRYIPTLSAEAGYRAGQTAQPSPIGTQFITTQTFSSNAALQYTLPYGTALAASIRLERAVQDSVVLGNLGTVYGTNLSLEVSQPWLKNFGEKIGRSGLRDAMLAEQIAQLDQQAQANQLASNVLAAYWNLWALERQLTVQQENLALQEASRKLAQVRFEAGSVAEADVITLQAEVAQARETVVTTRAQITSQRVELARLMGGLDEDLEQLGTGATEPERDDLPALSELMQRAALRSPELNKLGQSVERARLQSMLATNDARPDVQTVATLSVNGIGNQLGSALGQLGRFEAMVGYVGVRLSLPLVRQGLEAQADRAELAVTRAERELDAARTQLQARLLSTYTDVKLATERIALARETVEVSARSVELQQIRFELGEGTSFEVTQAIQRQREAELRVISAERDYRLGMVELRRLAGELVTFDQIEAMSR